MNKKILITGGAGYVGSHAAKLFLEKDFEVIVFDNYSTSKKEISKTLSKYGNVEFVEGDLKSKKDIDLLFQKHSEIDAVLHFAALCSVNESVQNPGLYFSNNVAGTINLLDSVIESNINKFIFSSTCAVYGESQYLPLDENHPRDPTNPYGYTKLVIEDAIKWYSKTYGLKYVILRYFNPCGAAEDGAIGDAKDPSVHLMQNAVRGALNLEPFKLTYSAVNTEDKSPIRDYIDINDLSDVHYSAYEYLVNGGNSDVFNVGTGKGNSVLEIVETVEKELNVKLPRDIGEMREGEYAAIYASNDKVTKTLNWTPKRTLKDSVLSLKKWYENNPNGYK